MIWILALINQGIALSEIKEWPVTDGRENVILTNTGCWSHDGKWIVYDVRSPADGGVFDGDRIERVHVTTGKVEVLFRAQNGAKCGVVTHNPKQPRVAFILGPEDLGDGFTYGMARRRGAIVETDRPGEVIDLDARDLVAPFTPGALRGGSHVHVWDSAGDWLSFTYEDHVLDLLDQTKSIGHEPNRRVVAVSVPGKVTPLHHHLRNHPGTFFSVVVTPLAPKPRPGSDDLIRACEEAWIGIRGYVRSDGTRQDHALAFQGTVLSKEGKPFVEVFVCDLPNEMKEKGQAPLEGTPITMPAPPKGVAIRRLTRTENEKYPGIQGPRHWLRSSPDGNQIAFLAKDNNGVVQIVLISPNGGKPTPLTHNQESISSCFSWSPDGKSIAHTMAGALCLTSANGGQTRVLLPHDPTRPIRPEAVVFSPDGKTLAFVRNLHGKNRIFLCGI